jgi:Zn-dependent M28 family amino/carboxypeptidase
MYAYLLIANLFASQNPIIKASTSNLKAHVTKLADSERFRNYLDLERLNESANYIKEQLNNYGYQAEFQNFTIKGNTYKNVSAIVGHGEKNRIVIGAHYDVCYETPGADDNASGVAGLLELSRLLIENKHQLNREVELVFYTLEEPPFFGTESMGSAIHATSLRQSKTKIDLMISIEMIGRFSEQENSQEYPIGFLNLIYPTVGNFIAVVGRLSDINLLRKIKTILKSDSNRIPIETIAMPRIVPGVSFSDHYQYWDQGYPALMITDTAFLRNHDYHTENDTSDKLDYDKMAIIVEKIYKIPFSFQNKALNSIKK